MPYFVTKLSLFLFMSKFDIESPFKFGVGHNSQKSS